MVMTIFGRFQKTDREELVTRKRNAWHRPCLSSPLFFLMAFCCWRPGIGISVLSIHTVVIILVWKEAISSQTSEKLSNTSKTMALVPYNPPNIFKQFQENERSFVFLGRTLTVYQNWDDFGVAAVVWDAAIVLGRYLEKLGTQLQGKKVIELGAGTALVGMVASLLGADVTVTDRKMALDISAMNIERNFGSHRNSINVKELDWGQNVTKSFPFPYDFVLGADVVYIEETFNDLVRTLNELCDENTSVLLSCRIRYERDNRFLKLLSKTFTYGHVVHDKDLGIEVYKATKHSQ